MQHRKVPGIGRGPQQFSARAPVQVQSPLGMPAPQQQAYPSYGEDQQDLAMEIYSRLAIDHIQTNQTPDAQILTELAIASKQAAAIYFQSSEGAQ